MLKLTHRFDIAHRLNFNRVGISTLLLLIVGFSTAGVIASNPTTMPFENTPEFSRADATRIAVLSKVNLDDFGILESISYSPDGKLCAYGAGNGILRIKELRTAGEVHSFDLFNYQFSAARTAWSPDAKRIIATDGERIAICDLTTAKIIMLPLRAPTGARNSLVMWRDPSKVHFFVDHNVEILDLDNLTYNNPYPLGDHSNDVSRLERKLSSSPLDHPLVSIHIGPTPDEIAVENRDHWFARVLAKSDVFGEAKWIVSPDAQHVAAMSTKGGITMYYLGLRQEPVMNFRVNLRQDRVMSAQDLSRLRECLRTNRPVLASVYFGKTNPLNNRLVGAEKSVWKGNIRVLEFDGTTAVVRVVHEAQTIAEKDVVADFRSTSDNFLDATNHPDAWTTLLPAEPRDAGAKERFAKMWRDNESAMKRTNTQNGGLSSGSRR